MSASGERSAFVRGKQERGLRLTLDLDALNRSDELEALLELGRHEEIEVTTTKPVGFSTISVGSQVSNRDMVEVQTQHPSGDCFLSGVWPASQWLRFADEHCRATGTAPSETQRRFLLAGAVVESADALVLQDTLFVHDVARRANPLTVDQAAALAGLFLRSRGHEEVALWNKGREKSWLAVLRRGPHHPPRSMAVVERLRGDRAVPVRCADDGDRTGRSRSLSEVHSGS
jgi:hypothetical protein